MSSRWVRVTTFRREGVAGRGGGGDGGRREGLARKGTAWNNIPVHVNRLEVNVIRFRFLPAESNIKGVRSCQVVFGVRVDGLLELDVAYVLNGIGVSVAKKGLTNMESNFNEIILSGAGKALA